MQPLLRQKDSCPLIHTLRHPNPPHAHTPSARNAWPLQERRARYTEPDRLTGPLVVPNVAPSHLSLLSGHICIPERKVYRGRERARLCVQTLPPAGVPQPRVSESQTSSPLYAQSLTPDHVDFCVHARRILSYLIPLRLAHGVLPSDRLLASFPRLSDLYTPLVNAYRQGNLKAYDDALLAKRGELVQRGTFLIVERAREGCLRTLFKKV